MTKQLDIKKLYKTKNGMYAFITECDKKKFYLYTGYCVDPNNKKVFMCCWDIDGEISYTNTLYELYKYDDLCINMPNPIEYWTWKHENGQMHDVMFSSKKKVVEIFKNYNGKPVQLIEKEEDND